MGILLGATFEGIHRKQRIVPGIGVRDSAWYSVIDTEWRRLRSVCGHAWQRQRTDGAERARPQRALTLAIASASVAIAWAIAGSETFA